MKRYLIALSCLLEFATVAGATGIVTGTVIDSATSSPVAGTTVTLLGLNNGLIAETITDGSGQCSQALPPDIYYAAASADGYVRQLYDHIPCTGSCVLNQGTPFAVTDGSTRIIDFALQPSGAIGGIVTDAGGLPLESYWVQIYLQDYQVASVLTDSQGTYYVGQLQPNSGFRAGTWSNGGPYINEMFNNIPCGQFCDPMAGTPIAVSAGSTTEADFALTAGGTISGSVSGSGVSLYPVLVNIFDSTGKYMTGAYTDYFGLFTTSGLPAGTYFAQTRNFSGYVDEVFADRPCSNDCEGACDPTAGTPIAVVLGADTPGINFDLSAGGGISGTITDSITSAPVPQAYVQIYDASGLVAGYTTSDDSGNYSVQGLLPGTYYVDVQPGSVYFEQLYNGISCEPLACPPTTGTPVSVVADGFTIGIDVALVRGGSIQGTFIDSLNGTGVIATVNVYDSSKNLLHASVNSIDDTYSVQSLQGGTYYLVARSYDHIHLDRVYGGPSCVADSCDLSGATPVIVTVGGTASASFSLDRGGTIAGTVTETETGFQVKSATVLAYDAAGHRVSVSSDGSGGTYETRALPPGPYYVLTISRGDHVDQLYAGIPCLHGNCDPTTGTPVQVAPESTTTVNFSLERGQAISGTVTDADTGNGIRALIRIYDTFGRAVSFANSYPFGAYQAGGLIPGTYYAVLDDNLGDYAGQLYDGIPCARTHCNILSGAPINVAAGSDTAGIDFAVQHGGRISGKVTDVRNGSGIEGVTIIILDANWNVLALGYTDCSGNYVTRASLPTGVYYAITLSYWDYIEQRYRDASCVDLLACDAVIGKGIAATLGTDTIGIDFALRPANTVAFIDDFENDVTSPAWTYLKGTWTEGAGALDGQNVTTATVVASPAFGGCSRCTVEGVLSTDARSVSLLGWYKNKRNKVELRMDPAKDRWILRQYVHGKVRAKTKVHGNLDINTNYRATIVFDGSEFRVSVDGSLLFSMPAVGKPYGTAGFRVRSGTGVFGEILIY